MGFVRVLMRYFAYLYHGLLALFLLAISLVAIVSGLHTLKLELLPWWKGPTLSYVVLAGGLAGLAAVVLAARGTARVLLVAWSAAVAILLLKGYVFSPFYFERGEISTAVWLLAGALVALAGAWFGLRTEPRRKKLY